MTSPNNPFYELSPDIKNLLAIETFRVRHLRIIGATRLEKNLNLVNIGKCLYNRLYRENIW